MTDPFADLPRNHYGAILADPPWHFKVWAGQRRDGAGNLCSAKAPDYDAMKDEDICALPVADLAADDCVLFLWTCWPVLQRSFAVVDAWGFEYKTCAFDWIKARTNQIEMFRDDGDVQVGMGYWTRANSEPCLLATRGGPKRLNADVRQGIIEPRRQHSRKPDCVHKRIERLVAGPYLELFARQRRPGWDCWGNEVDKYDPVKDVEGSFNEAYRAIRERKAAGGPGWEPK